MKSKDPDTLATAWLTYQRNWWAYEALRDLCENDPDAAWSAVLRIVAAAENDELLESLGAGPLEDLLRLHANQLVERVESEANASPKLRVALSHVWLLRNEDSVTARLVAAGCDLLAESRK